MYVIRHRSAQSLLEAIIAIGVILVATISATTLIVTTISAGRSSADKIQAANFAREGVEVVRSIRDSNWMKRAQNVVDGTGAGATTTRWDDNGDPNTNGYVSLGTAAGKCYVTVYDTSYGWFLAPIAGTPPCAVTTTARINNVTDNFGKTYFTSQYCPVACTRTKYSRTIDIKLLNDATAGDYLDVTATVTWNDHGAKTLVMNERLYDWR